MLGYGGKILRVDLTKQSIREESLPTEMELRKFFGGRLLGAKILFDELKPGIDPLGPENKLIFVTGPLNGIPVPGTGKYGVMAKSPLTNILGESYAGGFFGPELKFAGYDVLIFEGEAESPVYLWIHDGEVELKDARHLWGKTTGETEEIIKKEIGEEKAKVACIGQAGENLVRFASIASEIIHAIGRCGMGAVMGSKKLKAIAVRGTKRIKIANEKEFKKYSKKAFEELREFRLKRGWGVPFTHGSAGSVLALNESGRLPTMNFRRGTFNGADKITGEVVTETILIDRKSCFSCPHGCKRVVKVEKPYEVNPMYGGPEYETTAALGSLLLNDNVVSIAKANELCNKFSLDTISTGVVIAFSMECYEKGLLTKRETDGIDLTWGNHESILQLIEKIAFREGIGNLLAEGVKIAAQKIGRGAEKYAMHVKGLELPMHEPRGKKGVGLSYATSNRGGSQTQEFHDDTYEDSRNLAPEIGLVSTLIRDRLYTGPDKAKTVIIGQNWWSLYHSLVICLWAYYPNGISIDTLIGLVSSVTGWDVTATELLTIGERAWNLCRAFNVREGIGRKDDTLPERFAEPLPDGPYKGQSIPKDVLEKLLDYYYEFRGWDKKTGVPTKEKLDSLGLGYITL